MTTAGKAMNPRMGFWGYAKIEKINEISRGGIRIANLKVLERFLQQKNDKIFLSFTPCILY